MDEASRLRAVQRTGRRFGIASFAAIMSTFVVVCSAQILYQGFRAPDARVNMDCRGAVRQLIRDIRRARAAAELEVLGERAAMSKFRSAMTLSPTALRALENQCQHDLGAAEALRAVDEWRWAEENAVRYESVDLAPSRRRIRAIESNLGLSSPIAATPIP
jgi:hypothetical protein